MEQSLVRLLKLTLHLIRIRFGKIVHSTHLNPINRSFANCPGEAFSFVLVHSTPLASCEPVLLMRVLLAVLKNLQNSVLMHYIPYSGSGGRGGGGQCIKSGVEAISTQYFGLLGQTGF